MHKNALHAHNELVQKPFFHAQTTTKKISDNFKIRTDCNIFPKPFGCGKVKCITFTCNTIESINNDLWIVNYIIYKYNTGKLTK